MKQIMDKYLVVPLMRRGGRPRKIFLFLFNAIQVFTFAVIGTLLFRFAQKHAWFRGVITGKPSSALAHFMVQHPRIAAIEFALTALMVAVFAWTWKTTHQRSYGFAEIAFGLATVYNVVIGSRPPLTTAQNIAVYSAIYVMVRGLTNAAENKKIPVVSMVRESWNAYNARKRAAATSQ